MATQLHSVDALPSSIISGQMTVVSVSYRSDEPNEIRCRASVGFSVTCRGTPVTQVLSPIAALEQTDGIVVTEEFEFTIFRNGASASCVLTFQLRGQEDACLVKIT